MNSEDTKKTINMAAAMVLMVAVAYGIIFLVLKVAFMPLEMNMLRAQEGRLMAAQPEISLSVSEKASFVDAMASYAKADSKPLNRWIGRLASQERWGLMPPLPEGYKNPWVENVQNKSVLCPK